MLELHGGKSLYGSMISFLQLLNPHVSLQVLSSLAFLKWPAFVDLYIVAIIMFEQEC